MCNKGLNLNTVFGNNNVGPRINSEVVFGDKREIPENNTTDAIQKTKKGEKPKFRKPHLAQGKRR